MKSDYALVGLTLLLLALGTLASAIVWSDVSFAVKIGMYALGFSIGVASGALMVKRRV